MHVVMLHHLKETKNKESAMTQVPGAHHELQVSRGRHVPGDGVGVLTQLLMHGVAEDGLGVQQDDALGGHHHLHTCRVVASTLVHLLALGAEHEGPGGRGQRYREESGDEGGVRGGYSKKRRDGDVERK